MDANISIEGQINEPVIKFRKLANANSLIPAPRKK